MKRPLALLLLLTACNGISREDPERLGDIAWHEGRWADAVSLYRDAGDSPRILAKRADAAFQHGELPLAADTWTRLGVAAPERAGEAAAGLMRVADVAQRRGDAATLRLAVMGLRQVAPRWPLGRLARSLASTDLAASEAVRVLPVALTAVRGNAAAPILAALGRADQSLGDCGRAVAVYESALGRLSGAQRDTVLLGLASCEEHLGEAALQGARLGEAAWWFDRGAQRVTGSAESRRSLIGLGDASQRMGDLTAATIAWQTVATAPVPGDSITVLALSRLRAAGIAMPVPDSSVPPGRP